MPNHCWLQDSDITTGRLQQHPESRCCPLGRGTQYFWYDRLYQRLVLSNSELVQSMQWCMFPCLECFCGVPVTLFWINWHNIFGYRSLVKLRYQWWYDSEQTFLISECAVALLLFRFCTRESDVLLVQCMPQTLIPVVVPHGSPTKHLSASLCNVENQGWSIQMNSPKYRAPQYKQESHRG